MKLAGEFVFEAEVQDVWDALFDPEVLAAVMPGCEKLELVDGSYVGDIKVKVGPISGKFSGKVDLSDQVPPRSYKMTIDGRGQQGFVKATATVELDPEDGTRTRIKYDSDAHVGGRIASVGQRLVETAAKAIVKESLDNLNENIQIRTAALRAAREEKPAAPEGGPPPEGDAAHEEPAPDTPPQAAEAVTSWIAGVDDHKSAEEVVQLPRADEAGPAPAPEPSTAPASPAAPARPVIEYKRADAGKIARSVAKEVTKKMLPAILVAVAVIILIVYLIAR